MHLMTQSKTYELRVDLEDFEGQRVFAHYSSFSVDPESEGYRLNLGQFIKGSAGGTLKDPPEETSGAILSFLNACFLLV